MQTVDYKKRSLNSVKWSYAGNLLPKLITPIIYFILARLLSPDEFGLIAIAYLVISFVEMSRDAGMSRTVIQSDMDEKTLFHFRHMWVEEPAHKRTTAHLPHLNRAENTLYSMLTTNQYGENIRLEQERISFGYVCATLNRVFCTSHTKPD